MRSATPTLLDPFEVASARPPLSSGELVIEQVTEWFDLTELWEPEPVDRRWRARGWTDDD